MGGVILLVFHSFLYYVTLSEPAMQSRLASWYSRIVPYSPHSRYNPSLVDPGKSPNACILVRSYLSHRKQRVKLNGCYSDWALVKRGVPQGSILGPVLFNIYLNDLLVLLQNLCHIYNNADDNTLSFAHHDPHVIKINLERACSIAINWFKINFMKVNAEKFQFMILPDDCNNII